MKNLKFAVLVILTLAGAAWAVRDAFVTTNNDPRATHFISGLFVGPTSMNPPSDIKNKITRAVGCQVDYDFASFIPRPGFIQETVNYPCSGVKLGDPCFVGVINASPQDGGSAWEDNVNFFAIAKKADKIVIRGVSAAGDGGVMDPPDAGYLVRCLSNQ